MFEAVEFEELRGVPDPAERVFGEFEDEEHAVEAVRDARRRYLDAGGDNYAWWVVRQAGATLAEFIADSKSEKEFVLDISSGQLVEVE
jgi:non-ribosomal peptide synthetase component F